MKSYFPILLLMFTIFSCSDDQVNDSKIDNFESSIEELSKLPLNKQRLESNNLNPANKLYVWNQKFDILIKSIDDSNHRNFISEFQKKLNIELFEKGLNANEYENEWSYFIEKLQQKYNWTDDDVYVFFATFITAEVVKNKNIDSVLKYSKETLPDYYDKSSCNCRWGGLGCAGAECNDRDSCPEEIKDEMGCGFIFLQSCSGSFA